MSKLRAVLPTKLGSGTVLELDGHDITHSVRALYVDAQAGSTPPVVTIDLMLRQGIELDLDAPIRVTESVADLLIALGWHPPQDAK